MVNGPKQYQPVNRCIYCGATEVKLTNEHILMYALGGREVLPKASCRPCAVVTGQIEQFVARDMWGGFRVMSGMQSRNNKKKAVTNYPLIVQALDEIPRRILIPVKEMPGALVFPKLPLPVFLTGQAFDTYDAIGTIFNADELHKYAGQRMHLPPINLQLFARFLAKIAHAFATAELGIGNFTPLLSEVILGRHPQPSHFIGSLNADLPAEENTYRMTLIDFPYESHTYKAVTLRLFGMFGMPEYIVITGT
jgi:hypothetical protein